MTPFTIRHKITGDPMDVPCGKCPACVARRASAWSFRLMQQEKIAETSYFLTLTYSNDYVPFSNSGLLDLCKRAPQLFFKKLRKVHENDVRNGWPPIKYYLCGEYGGRTLRPHYHCIIFNCKLELMMSKKDQMVLKMFDYDGQMDINCYQWPQGGMSVGKVTAASVGYSLKYMSKLGKIPAGPRDDRNPEFALMSKGLGANYLTENMRNWHHADAENRMYCPIEDGKKISMPRYYKQKLYTDDERKRIGLSVRSKMLQEKYKLEENPMYHHNKFYSDLQAFEKMKQNSLTQSKL